MTSTLNDIVDLFSAFGDITRLRLINALLDGEACVCHLSDTLNVAQPNVSRHLSALRRAGLVRTRRSGKWAYYSIVPAQTGLPLSVLNHVRSMRSEATELQKDVQRLREIRAGSNCDL